METEQKQKCTVIKAPLKAPIQGLSVFLSGSVQTGEPVDWQTKLVSILADQEVTILNPRLDYWDSSWKQDISNPMLKKQVLWELDYMEQADIIATYIAPNTTSPITMLEFGLHARDKKQIVCCPEGFSRRGNVQVICERYETPMVDTIEELGALIVKRINQVRDRKDQLRTNSYLNLLPNIWPKIFR